MGDPTETPGVSLATSQPAPLQPSASASRPSGIAAITGLASAVAALVICGPMVIDNDLPQWVRIWAAGMITLVGLPPSHSLALIGNFPRAIAAWRGKGSP